MTAQGDRPDPAKEIARLRAMMQHDPGSRAFHRLADALTRAGRPDEAVQVCQEGLRRHPRLASGQVSLGRALLASGKLERAEAALLDAGELSGAGVEAYLLLAQARIRRGAPREAIETLLDARARGYTGELVDMMLQRARDAAEQLDEFDGAAPQQQTRPSGKGKKATGSARAQAAAGADGAAPGSDAASGVIDLKDTLPMEEDRETPLWSSIENDWEASMRQEGDDESGPVPLSPALPPRVPQIPLTDPLAPPMPPARPPRQEPQPGPEALEVGFDETAATRPFTRSDEDELDTAPTRERLPAQPEEPLSDTAPTRERLPAQPEEPLSDTAPTRERLPAQGGATAALPQVLGPALPGGKRRTVLWVAFGLLLLALGGAGLALGWYAYDQAVAQESP